MEKSHITELINQHLRGTISDDDRLKLMEWAKHVELNEFQEVFGSAKPFTEEYSGMPDLFRAQLESKIDELEAVGGRRVVLYQKTWFRVAAVILGAVSIIALYFFPARDHPSNKIVAEKTKVSIPEIQPGGDRAVLTLGDGRTIVLDTAANGQLAFQGGASIIKSGSGNIIYQPGKAGSQAPATQMNTIATPKGGQYHIVIPDGTNVWLNAASSISYPVPFENNKREVTITGEVYFEVAKDASRPFSVKSYSDTIVVLGTAFNVNSYHDEGPVRTTVAEGTVRVGKLVLKRGEAAENGKRTYSDITADLSWKRGLFAFSNADLPTIMRQLSRWYDIEVEYQGTIPKSKFSGEFYRSTSLSESLEILRYFNVNFNIQGRKIIIIS
jgi:ferric-dicitrate binding protein FerR (iron transport regulator)